MGAPITVTPGMCVAAADAAMERGIMLPASHAGEIIGAALAAAPSTPQAEALTVLQKLVGELDSLMDDSEGVAGLHKNGDIAPWDDLMSDGRYPWLGSLDEARAVCVRPATSEAGNLAYPEELTPALLDALGYLNFQTGPIAHALRAAGADIPRKCEAEQAHVLHWFIRLVLQHGDGWREAVRAEVRRIADAAQPKEAARG